MSRRLTIISALWLFGTAACNDSGSGTEFIAGPGATGGTGQPTMPTGGDTARAGTVAPMPGTDGEPGTNGGMDATPPTDAGSQEAPSKVDAAQEATPDAGPAGSQDGAPNDAAPPNTIPADSPAPMDVSKWADDGRFGSRVVNNSGPDGSFTLFVPDPLAGNGTLNPIITWGNGSFTTPSSYRSLLSHYASHGFFVVASNNTNVGSGAEMIAGMRWAIAENGRSGSPYFGKLDPDAVGSIGYSQGGIGAVITGNEPEVKTTVPIAGGDETIVNIVHPVFLVGNEDDTAAPIDVISPQFTSEDTKGPFVFGILLGTGHLETLGDGGRHRGYTTAWLAYHLLGDQEAYRVFYGDEQCTLCTDRAWKTQRKNLP